MVIFPRRPDPESHFEAETWLSDEEKSVACVTLKGVGAAVRNLESDTTYQVISGVVKFARETHNTLWQLRLMPGNEVTIPKGAAYQDFCDDEVVMLATCIPPFNPDAIEVIQPIAE